MAALNQKSEKSGVEEEKIDEELPLTVQPKKNQVFEKDVTPLPKFGYKPVELTCPNCNTRTKTNLAYHITEGNHIAVFICSLATWPCGLCFLAGIPFCMPWCQKVDHHCSACNTIIAQHSKWF